MEPASRTLWISIVKWDGNSLCCCRACDASQSGQVPSLFKPKPLRLRAHNPGEVTGLPPDYAVICTMLWSAVRPDTSPKDMKTKPASKRM